MPRIQLTLPDIFPFSTTLQVYQSHINEAGHVDNAQLLSLVSEARQRFFHALGFKQLDVDGVGIVVADAALQYLSEAFYSEQLQVDVAANDFNKYGCDLVFRIQELTTQRPVAHAKTGIVFFDYQTRKVAPVPQAFVAAVLALSSHGG